MRTARSMWVILALLCAVCAGARADVRTLPLAAEESRLEMVGQEREALHYRVAVGELTAMEVTTREGLFTRLLIPGFHSSHREGAPELPMMNRLIEIPAEATVRIEMIGSESRSLSLEEFGALHPLFPAQPSMPKNADPESWPFVYDRAAYQVPRVAQELVRVVETGRLRAVRLGRLEVSPVEYFPAENRVEVTESIEFRVVFEGADTGREAQLKALTASPFFEPLYERIDGYRGLHDDYPDVVRDVVTMVVVAPPEFVPQLQPFVDWKTERGFITILAVTGTPEVGTTSASIQAYIHDLYLNATPEQPAPSFVLFVGDVAQMPTFTLSGDATDRPYCDVEGDLVPDIYYGRFSATNPTELQAILDKTLMYDQFTMPDPSYLEEVVMIAGMDSYHGSTWGNGQIGYGTTYYFNLAHGITSHTYLYPESGSHAGDIVQHVSDGVGYINYTAHGNTTSWADPSFTQANVAGLQNYGEYCLAVGNCCLTSSYEIGECFAETWLRAEDKGAIGYIGGSNSTLWDEDYHWGVGNTASILANPTYEQSGLGAYDGIFHDHGEAMTQWYITNDAIIFSGNLAVMESGSSNTTYYWNIYNLMGDPSLTTYLGQPTTHPVGHPATIFTTWTSIEITADPNSYVGLTKSGDLVAAGTVDETGTLDLQIWEPLTPGSARLVVMAQNREPYIADLNVIVPATVFIDPQVIDANVETEIQVGVFEYDAVTPRPGVEIWADGLDYESGHAFTDATGYCTITVNYPYGPTLDIVGQDPAEPWELFREAITVQASVLQRPMLSVTTEIGLENSFAVNLPGVLHATVNEPGHTLWALLNDTPVASTTEDTLELTPGETGSVEGIIAVSGYNLFRRVFPVIEAFGTLTGHVDAVGMPAVGALVRGYDDQMELAFQATTNAAGDYDVGEDILCASYTVTVDYFGYLPWEQAYFVNFGANVLDVALVAAPSGVLTGTVTETGTGLPLQATVKVYRSDTMELYAETTSSAVDGSYTTPSLPYFDYLVTVKAWHHIPQTINVTVEQPEHVYDFALEPTIGDLLVIDDGAKAGPVPAKLDSKTGTEIASAYLAQAGKTTADLVADLEDLGYTVTTESMATTDPSSWANYDLLLTSSGSNTSSLASATFRSALISFVGDGGHVLVEGGEVGYDHYGDAAFAETVLHITDWDHDNSGNLTVSDPTHYVMSVPNTIVGPVSMTYVGYGDEDAVDPTSDAQAIASWSDYPENASLVVYDPNPAPEGGQVVFFAFNYSAMDAAVRPLLLQNAVTWLMTPEFGDCTVSGTVTLEGQSDHSGVLVEAVPNGGSMITGPTGEFTLPDLFAGPYMIRATKEDWATAAAQVDLTAGQHLTGIDLIMTPVTTVEECRQPNLPIPDYNPTGVSDAMEIDLGGATISEIAVYVDILHTYQGDLIVEVISPSGTTVRLHDRSGGGTYNVIGWYPDELAPAEDLAQLIGEPTDGTWTLRVSDNASYDTGTLREWCLRISYGSSAADVGGGDRPLRLALSPNRPNPLRPATTIHFALPQAGPVKLAVYDMGGRQIATLVSGALPAGYHQVSWQGRDGQGRAVASGVYFYRLETEKATLTRKLMVVR